MEALVRRVVNGSMDDLDLPDNDNCAWVPHWVEAELHFLRFFYEYSDFGPATDDVVYLIKQEYKMRTGRALPDGYST